jgi:WD40 repeat protein
MMQECDNPQIQAPPRQEFLFDAAITGLAFLAKDTLAAGLGDGSVRLIGPAEGASPITVQPHREGAAILAMAVDIDGAGVVTSGDDGRVARTDARGEVSVLAELPGRQADVVAVSPSGGLRAVAAGRELRLLDRAGETAGATADHPSTVTGLAFNPRGKRLALSHYGGATLRWTGKLDQGATRLEWRGSHIGVTWSPDGTTVLTTMQERELHGWRLTDHQTMSMAGYASKVRSMDWLRRPMILATSGGDCVTAWSFTGRGPMGKPPLTVGSGLGRLVTSVAIHPKNPIVAAGFDEGQVIVCALTGPEKGRALAVARLGAD